MSAIREGRLTGPSNAPLFHSAADFLPEDPEHEQERLDLYSLERSRRHFGAYAPSSSGVGEGEYEEGEGEEASGSDSEGSTQELRRSRGRRFPGNLKSSWRADRSGTTAKGGSSAAGSVFSNGTARGGSRSAADKMVDVRLDDSSSHVAGAGGSFFGGFEGAPFPDADDDDHDDGPPDDIAIEMPREDSPLPFQHFNRPPRQKRDPSPSLAFVGTQADDEDDEDARDQTPFIPRESQRAKGSQSTVSLSHHYRHQIPCSQERRYRNRCTIRHWNRPLTIKYGVTYIFFLWRSCLRRLS